MVFVLVALVDGVEGTLDTKMSGLVSYMWVDANGGYLSAIFYPDTMKCSRVSGRF